MNDLYQELIIDHGTAPRNFAIVENPSYTAEAYNPLCGDQITLFLVIKEQIITKVTFQGHGCAISTASASIMTELLLGKTIIEALELFKDFINILTDNKEAIKSTTNNNKLPEKLLALLGVKNYPARVKCATLAWHTLNSALNPESKASDNKVIDISNIKDN